MDIRVTVGTETRIITPLQFMDSCEKRGVQAEVGDWFNVRLCGHGDVTRKFKKLLEASPELEAAVLIELAKANGELLDALAEREAILFIEGLPHESIDVALAMTVRRKV
jgi:EAL domain-containing protein (putative c-di-GMP-specific phosphodiesterase class I)